MNVSDPRAVVRAGWWTWRRRSGRAGADSYDCGEAQVGLPPLTRSRNELWRSYGMRFIDGPIAVRERRGEKRWAHPMYGAYAIDDYLTQHRRTADATYLEAARRVCDATLRRLTPGGGNPVCWVYEAEDGYPAYASGLTQARWLDVLSRLATFDIAYLELAQSALEVIAERCVLRGARVALSGGGSAWLGDGLALEHRRGPDGATLVLNGWLTAVRLLDDHDSRHGSAAASEIVEGSIRALTSGLLDRYDLPDQALSLYALGGRFRRPCPWSKVIAGRAYNSYHWMHVRTLDGLADVAERRRLDSAELRYWSKQWRTYVDRWHGEYGSDKAADDPATRWG